MEVRIKDAEAGSTLTQRKTTDGSYVLKDAVVLEYKTPSGEMIKLKAPIEGVVTFDRAAKKGAEMVQDMLIARIEPCQHAIVIKDMCATCGRDLREKDGRAGQRREDSTANVSMIHHVPELIVSDDLAKELGSADLKNVLSSRKLVLLVDLDQTIIHTTNRPFKIDPNKHSDIHTYKMFGTEYHTKLRPYTHEFLEHMSTLFEMHIITYGQRQYAHKIAEILDPKKTLFAQRILSRDELFSAQHKTRNLRALFPCGDQLIVIIDDRADVWQFSEALIQVKPYRFFKEVGDINAPCGASKEGLLPVDVEDDAEHDRTLEYIERMLTNIHSNFYKHYEKTKEIRDVKVVISYLKKQILRGLVVVLSGVVPLGVKPEHSEAYRLCVQFGATVADQVNEQTTHLVAVRWGTTKVMAACKLGIPIVTPHWLYASVEKLMKADEKEFELTKDSKPPEGRPLSGRIIPELTSIDAMKKETIAAMEHEVDEVLSEDDDDEEEEEEALKRRLNGGDGSGDEDDEIEKELAKKRARWEREGNFDVPEDEQEDDNAATGADDSFCEGVYDDTVNGSSRDQQVLLDEEETRDIPYDDEDDEEIEDMAALIERQVSHE
ncbi:BRCA1 protein [Necator americanus]|uniref:RNA polymerase II subunit A C-terminal domain phosphatase n=1 Tax=Necator americanus TaxID=51031 RepID=W2TJG4_NECAM|nr:BRCA1 protein [Necator americanus]ETN81943.1 BRCA1 protein [Necator americanus]